MNSAVRLNFNESFVELDNLWVLWTVQGNHWQRRKCAETSKLSLRLERIEKYNSIVRFSKWQNLVIKLIIA